RLSYDFSLPGQNAYVAGLAEQHAFGSGGLTTPTLIVARAPSGSVAAHFGDLSRAVAADAAANPAVRLVSTTSAGRSFVTRDGSTAVVYLFTPPNKSLGTDPLVTAAVSGLSTRLPGWTVGQTGVDALAAGGAKHGPGVLIETVVGGVGALVVLAFVFASVLALVPLLVAMVSILSTLLLVLGLTYLTTVSFIVQFLVALVGLGVAIDYSLLVVTRWREERDRGRPHEEAIVAAMSTAGRAVVTSGLTVAIGLLSLVVLPVPFLRSTGVGGLLIPLVSVVAVITLLPALLASVGSAWDWPHRHRDDVPSRPWSRWARGISRRPWLSGAAALLVLGLAVAPVFSIRVGQTSAAAESQSGTAHDLYASLQRGGFSPGVITPIEVVTSSSSARAVVGLVANQPGVTDAFLPAGASGSRHGLSEVIVVPAVETVDSSTLGPVRAVEAAVHGQHGVVGVTGEGAEQQAFSSAVYGNVPLMIAVLAILMLVVLTRAFRSLVLAAKAVVLNLVSLAATFGVLTWFWQDGHGSSAIFSIPATGAITFWVPISVFAFLFGLSMDYEIFILSRIREEHDAGRTTVDAAVTGLARTGRLVTSAALILFLAFASLASAPLTDVKVLATGLGVGILLDATVIRSVLVPSLVVVLGRWNWWIPRWLARALRVPPPALAGSAVAD
ncbi:MAG TPA: MMPL family transporter, partial [Acidimicrobiales bacterium]|nr:MMPL family transporter [Acidimicrobiales bacterium]